MDLVRLFLHQLRGQPEVDDLGADGEGVGVHGPGHSGIRGWLSRRLDTFKTRWHEAHSGLTGRLHQLWDRLHSRTPRDEPVLARFWRAHRIDVYHHDQLDPREARALWDRYLTSRRRRHLPRFALNVAISPLTIVLAPLPGPNIVGYWFVYRSVHHLLILYGLRRARARWIETSFHPVSEPMEPVPVVADALVRVSPEEIDAVRAAD